MIPTLKLNTGASIPVVGLGCWLGFPGTWTNEECYNMVTEALKLGYRHLDTALGYGNEEAEGKAIRESGVPREEIFLTTKLTNRHHGMVDFGLKTSLDSLGLDYVDLYLMHWPQASDPDPSIPFREQKIVPFGESPTFVETWVAMQKLLETGKVKAIGVSNFSIKNLEILLAGEGVTVVPAANQVEAHLYHPNNSLRKYCQEKGIIMTAYSPLGQPREGEVVSPILVDPAVVKISEKYKKPVGTIALSWLVQSGWTVIPKSSNEKRMIANKEIITLEKEDFDELSAIHTQPGKLRKLCNGQENSAETGVVFGWTLKEMGWEKLD